MDSPTLSGLIEETGLKVFLRVFPSEALVYGKQIGVGGFAAVWRGTLALPNVGELPVAIKVTLAVPSPREMAAWLSEARVALTVRGANVCSLLGASVRGGHPCLIMPAYDASLEHLLDEDFPDGMPLPLSLDVAVRIAHGLLDVHSNGVTHRDLVSTRPVASAAFHSNLPACQQMRLAMRGLHAAAQRLLKCMSPLGRQFGLHATDHAPSAALRRRNRSTSW